VQRAAGHDAAADVAIQYAILGALVQASDDPHTEGRVALAARHHEQVADSPFKAAAGDRHG
jgi:hypothetical protein